MRYILLSMLCVCSFLYGMNVQPDGGMVTYYDNGHVAQRWERKGQKRDGKSTRWYPTGEVQWEGHYTGGVREGTAKLFARTGELLRETTYVAGKLEGKQVWYFRDEPTKKSCIRLVEHYREGVRDGASTLFYRDGSVHISKQYRHGLLEGVVQEFRTDGSLFKKTIYKNGLKEGVSTVYFYGTQSPYKQLNYHQGKKTGLQLLYSPDGELIQSSMYVDGKKHGDEKYFFAGGGSMEVVPYRGGKRSGVRRTYYRTGEIKTEEPYTNGKIDGEVKRYYPLGRLAEVIPYVQGKREGVRRVYHEDGSKSMIPYKNNKKEGVAKIYFPTGTVQVQEHWADGKREGERFVYDTNAVLKRRETYHRGFLDGLSVDFYPNAAVHQEDIYEQGALRRRRVYSPSGNLTLDHFFKKPSLPSKEVLYPSIISSIVLKTGEILTPVSQVRFTPRTISALYQGSRTILQRETIDTLRTEKGEYTKVRDLPTRNGDRLLFYSPTGTIAWNMKGCFDKGGTFYPTGVVNQYHANGRVAQTYTMTDGFMDGLYRSWYPNGSLHIRCYFKRGGAKAIFDGEWVEYADDASIQQKMNYVDGVLQGEHFLYYPTGSLREKRNYTNGLLEGLVEKWYPTGVKKETGFWLLGKRSGILKRYYPTGTIAEEATWLAGILQGPRLLWHKISPKDGYIYMAEKAVYKGNYKEGEVLRWFDNGKKQSRQYYREGTLVGKQTRWDRRGWILNETDWNK